MDAMLNSFLVGFAIGSIIWLGLLFIFMQHRKRIIDWLTGTKEDEE